MILTNFSYLLIEPPQLDKLGNKCTVELLTERAMPYFNYSEDIELAEQWKTNGAKLVLKSYERYPIFKNHPILQENLCFNLIVLLCVKYLSRMIYLVLIYIYSHSALFFSFR